MSQYERLPDQLIAQIYDTAVNPAQWPQLLNQLAEFIPSIEQQAAEQTLVNIGVNLHTQARSISHNEPMLDSLSNHLERGAQISQQLGDNQQQQALQKQLFEQLPLPALLLSAEGEVLLQNQQALHTLANTSSLKVSDQRVVLQTKLLQRQFNQIIEQLVAPNPQHSALSMPLRESFQAQAISLNLSRVNDMWQLGGNILLFIACAEAQTELDLESFYQAYQLTPAEQRLMALLIKERTLHEIAKQNKVSINTVRSQLKSIFSKTACHRQSELIKLALTTSKPSEVEQAQSASLLQQQHLGAPCYHQQWAMTAQHTQSYSDVGPRAGIPLLMFHPSTGSRLQQHPNKNLVFEHGIRLITPDRAGFGLSTQRKESNTQTAAQDMLRLADHLQLERFSVAGFCGGGPFALALASMAPDRVLHTSLISTVSPYQSINLLHGVKTGNKLLAYIGLNAPKAMQPLLSFIARHVMSEPESYFDQVYPFLCESDAAALSEPEVTSGFLLAFREAMRQGSHTFAEELAMLSRTWSIDFTQIQSTVTLWHGAQDQHVPIQLVRLLSDELPQANLLTLEPHGHLLIYHCWAQILSEISQKTTSQQQHSCPA